LNRYASGALCAALVWATALPAYAAHTRALSAVAAELGFEYSYLGPEDAVALTKPGVTILIRPGESLFDVNDRTESIDGPAPTFDTSDIYISDSLYARLRAIAGRYPANAGEHGLVVANPGVGNVTGAITGLTLAQVPGRQELAVGGKAPANLPITITLVATFSMTVPDTVLSRHEVTTDPDGTFKADVSIAPAYFTGEILTVVASSVDGIKPAKAKIEMGFPNVSTPADLDPRSIR